MMRNIAALMYPAPWPCIERPSYNDVTDFWVDSSLYYSLQGLAHPRCCAPQLRGRSIIPPASSSPRPRMISAKFLATASCALPGNVQGWLTGSSCFCCLIHISDTFSLFRVSCRQSEARCQSSLPRSLDALHLGIFITSRHARDGFDR